MSELVCLNCGRGMEQDWAPCSHCGWKVPETWEGSPEEPGEKTPASRYAILSRPQSESYRLRHSTGPIVLIRQRKWIKWTAIGILAVGLTRLLLWIFK